MDLDDYAELMAEAPGGMNHGRRKGQGGWLSNEPIDFSLLDRKDMHDAGPIGGEASRKSYRQYRHGTLYGYLDNKCRCPLCRTAWATYVKERRGRLR